jgi:putative PIN family toxin of toxin-antitoxin system
MGKVTFLTSEELLVELNEVITSKRKPFQLDQSEANEIIDHLKSMAEIVCTKTRVSVCEDDPDNRVLECASDGNADYILTGDKDLLKLRAFKGITIAKIGDFPLPLPTSD